MAVLSWLMNRGVLLYLALASIAFAVFYVGNLVYDISLRDAQYFNGWILVAGISVLMFLTFRKKVVILPFGQVRKWLKLHYYLGFVTVGVFVVHTNYQIPDSPLEWLLWCLFVLIAVSGIIGGVISKVIPPRLEARGESILFERIATYRVQLAAQAEELVRQSIKHGNTLSISNLYNDMLAEYFAGHRNIIAHLRASTRPLAGMLGALDAIERYLDKDGKGDLEQMRALVEAKNNLDFRYANGALMKLWLFFHIPATYAMMVAIIVHIIISYAFSTGIA